MGAQPGCLTHRLSRWLESWRGRGAASAPVRLARRAECVFESTRGRCEAPVVMHSPSLGPDGWVVVIYLSLWWLLTAAVVWTAYYG